MGSFKLTSLTDGIYNLCFDLENSKVNKITATVGQELLSFIDQIERNDAIRALILTSGKEDTFIAGADINEIGAIQTADEGARKSREAQKIPDRLEFLKKPVIAAIHGACLGGGCEVVLACSYRIATDDPRTRIGLPEVNLGILPGMGGCVRLPRLIGLPAALDIILAGKALTGKAAWRVGLVDEAVPASILMDICLERARQFIRAAGPVKKRKNYFFQTVRPLKRFICQRARKAVLAKTKGNYPAPLQAIEVIERTLGLPLREALAIESEKFGQLSVTPECKNLVNLFFMQEAAKKPAVLSGVNNPRKIKKVGIVGAGVMGGGIAQLALDRGYTVRMKDIKHEAVLAGFQTAQSLFNKLVERRRLTPYDVTEKMSRLSGGLDYTGFQQMDAVIEAVIEEIDVKKRVFAELETKVSSTTVLATNTSSLSVDKIAEGLKMPSRVVGLHFFNPVHRMPLVEIIRGNATTDEVLAQAFTLAKSLGKTPVVVKNAPGFLVNRLLMPYLNEAAYLLEEGVPMEKMDQVMENWGMPMGPIALIDEVGIDVSAKVAKILHEGLGERVQPHPYLGKMVSSGRLGKKNKKGFYLHDKRAKRVDSSLYAFLGVKSQGREISDAEIVQRLIYSMINEASRALSEGIVETASLLDLAMILGTGFPPFRGGLLRFADQEGVSRVMGRLSDIAHRAGDRLKPSEELQGYVKGFYAG